MRASGRLVVLLVAAVALANCSGSQPTPSVSSDGIPSHTAATTDAPPPTSAPPTEPPVSGPTQPSGSYEVLFTLEVGKDIEYLVPPEGEDGLILGPVGIEADENGVLWIGDLVPRIMRGYTMNGEKIAEIDLSEYLEAFGDFVVSNGTIAIFDAKRQPHTLVLVDVKTKALIVRKLLPEEFNLGRGFSGLHLQPSGVVVAEFEGGQRFIPMVRLMPGPLIDWEVPRDSVQVIQSPAGPIDISSGPVPAIPTEHTVSINGHEVMIQTQRSFGGIRFGGATADLVVLSVSDVWQDADFVIRADDTLRFFDTDGNQTGAARLPPSFLIGDGFRYWTLTPDGDVVALWSHETTVDVIRVIPEPLPQE